MDETPESEPGSAGSERCRAVRVRARARGAARANLAGALGTVWATFGGPGSVLLTLFLKEGLHAAKWQIGLVLTMTYLGPTLEPLGAYLAERLGRRRLLFLVTHLLNRLAFFTFALIPLLQPADEYRDLGIALICAVVGGSRVVAHLGAPAWWSWMGDLVPERRRGRFFGYRTQAASAVTALSFVVGMSLLQSCGGMNNPGLVSALFAVGAFFGTLDILLYLGVPEPPLRPAGEAQGWRAFLKSCADPYRQPQFCRLLLGMGLWSFSANLVLPFLPVYQHGETVAGHQLGLGATWLFLAVLNVSSSLAAVLTSRWWAGWSERLGPRRLLLIGSGYLFVNLAYLVVGPDRYLGLLVPVALVGGALNAAWTVSSHQLLLDVAPQANRSYYVSAHNCTNGWLMAGGPLLGGLLADRLPVLDWQLPTGLPCCYFHLLLFLAVGGAATALVVLSGVGIGARPRAQPEKVPAVRLWRAPVHGWRRVQPAHAAVDRAEEFATL